MLSAKSFTTDNGIRIEFYYDRMSYLVAYLEITANDAITVEVYADLEDLTAPEMRELWAKLKIGILPENFMEEIRASVLAHLQNVDRVDLVSVCLDSAAPNGEAMRL